MAGPQGAILVDPMEEDGPIDDNELDEVFTWAWPDVNRHRPRSFLEINGRREHYVATGEFVCLRRPVYFTAKRGPNCEPEMLQSTVARVLTVQSHSEKEVDVWLNLLIAADSFPSYPLAPVGPPNQRTYIQFPPEIIWTNVAVKLDASEVISEAFVFRLRHILFNDAGMCYGMENAFFARLRWNRNSWEWSGIPDVAVSGFEPFPFMDCYTRRQWENLLRIARLISFEMARSSISQSTRQSKKVHCTKSMWDYLRYRLEPQVEVKEKVGVSTILYVRKNGTKEVIKCRVIKESIRLDTSSLFALLQSVLGTSITLGLRNPSPSAPKLRGQQSLSHVALRSSNEDSFNLFFPLPENSLDGLTHRPRHRGVDFHFDSNKRELRVAFRFRRASPFDTTVLEYMASQSHGNGDDPDLEGSSDGMEDNDNNEPEIVIKAGDHLGNDHYVLCVKRVLNRSTHVVVDVVESTDNNFVAGVERILTMEHALALYREYNDL
jgi:hypothetical protein